MLHVYNDSSSSEQERTRGEATFLAKFSAAVFALSPWIHCRVPQGRTALPSLIAAAGSRVLSISNSGGTFSLETQQVLNLRKLFKSESVKDIVQTVLDLLCLDDPSLVQDFRADTMPEPICGHDQKRRQKYLRVATSRNPNASLQDALNEIQQGSDKRIVYCRDCEKEQPVKPHALGKYLILALDGQFNNDTVITLSSRRYEAKAAICLTKDAIFGKVLFSSVLKCNHLSQTARISRRPLLQDAVIAIFKMTEADFGRQSKQIADAAVVREVSNDEARERQQQEQHQEQQQKQATQAKVVGERDQRQQLQSSRGDGVSNSASANESQQSDAQVGHLAQQRSPQTQNSAQQNQLSPRGGSSSQNNHDVAASSRSLRAEALRSVNDLEELRRQWWEFVLMTEDLQNHSEVQLNSTASENEQARHVLGRCVDVLKANSDNVAEVRDHVSTLSSALDAIGRKK